MNLKKSFYWCFLYTLLCIFSNLNIFQFCRRRSHHNNGNGGQSDAESDASGISWASGLQVNLIKNQTIFRFLLFPQKSAIKVHVFWKGYNSLRNLHCRFVLFSASQIYAGNFSKSCGLLRIYELYFGQFNFFFSKMGHSMTKWTELYAALTTSVPRRSFFTQVWTRSGIFTHLYDD